MRYSFPRSNWASYWASHEALRKAREEALRKSKAEMERLAKTAQPGKQVPHKCTFVMSDVIGHGMARVFVTEIVRNGTSRTVMEPVLPEKEGQAGDRARAKNAAKLAQGFRTEVVTFPDIRAVRFEWKFFGGHWYEVTAFPNLRYHFDHPSEKQKRIRL